MKSLFRVLTLATVLAALTFSVFPQAAPAAPKTFEQQFEAFSAEWDTRSQNIRSQQQFQEFQKWQTDEVTRLMQMVPDPAALTPAQKYCVGSLLQLKSEHEKAAEYYQACLAALPDHAKAAHGLIQCYLELNKPVEAEKLFLAFEGKMDAAKAGNLAINLGQTFGDANQPDKAIRYLKMGLEKEVPEEYRSFIVEMIADILVEADRKSEGLEYLKAQMDKFKDNTRALASLESKKKQIESVGGPATELQISRWVKDRKATIGELKGKVILLDFWAPWCGPCRAAFPELKEMYKNFHEKGLEIIGVTTYYGSYKDGKKNEAKVTPEREFELISEFVQTNELPWLVGVAEAKINHEAYNVTGIPHLVVIDRSGAISKIEVGFNPNSTRLMKYVEGLVTKAK